MYHILEHENTITYSLIEHLGSSYVFVITNTASLSIFVQCPPAAVGGFLFKCNCLVLGKFILSFTEH
jgi:hypothetical protein